MKLALEIFTFINHEISDHFLRGVNWRLLLLSLPQISPYIYIYICRPPYAQKSIRLLPTTTKIVYSCLIGSQFINLTCMHVLLYGRDCHRYVVHHTTIYNGSGLHPLRKVRTSPVKKTNKYTQNG